MNQEGEEGGCLPPMTESMAKMTNCQYAESMAKMTSCQYAEEGGGLLRGRVLCLILQSNTDFVNAQLAVHEVL